MPNYKQPVSVLVVVYTRQGEVLLLRRGSPDDFWQSVTGSLEWGETPEQAAVRELEEETGISVHPGVRATGVENRFPIHPAWRPRYAPDVQSNLEYVFRLKLPQACDIRLNPKEHVEFCWLPWQEAAERATSYTNRDAILALSPIQDMGAGPRSDL